YEDRMDPHRSATMFFEALMKIENRDSLSITEAAHRVQGNADPNHYADFEQQGRDLVAELLAEEGINTDGTSEADTSQSLSTNCATTGSADGEGIPDQTALGEPSSQIACPEGSTDLGVHDGAYQGDRIPIRLCSIEGTVCTGSDCRAGDLGGRARGEVVINARFAPYFQAWLASVREQGKDPVFSSSFRSWETQSRISGGGSNANAAANGKSHHQTGAAVDVSGLPGSYNKNQCSGYAPDGGCMTGGDLWTALHAAGHNHGMTVHDQEFWHFEFILSGDHRGRTNSFATLRQRQPKDEHRTDHHRPGRQQPPLDRRIPRLAHPRHRTGSPDRRHEPDPRLRRTHEPDHQPPRPGEQRRDVQPPDRPRRSGLDRAPLRTPTHPYSGLGAGGGTHRRPPHRPGIRPHRHRCSAPRAPGGPRPRDDATAHHRSRAGAARNHPRDAAGRSCAPARARNQPAAAHRY